jgi:hypothetical protein
MWKSNSKNDRIIWPYKKLTKTITYSRCAIKKLADHILNESWWTENVVWAFGYQSISTTSHSILDELSGRGKTISRLKLLSNLLNHVFRDILTLLSDELSCTKSIWLFYSSTKSITISAKRILRLLKSNHPIVQKPARNFKPCVKKWALQKNRNWKTYSVGFHAVKIKKLNWLIKSNNICCAQIN